MIIPITYFTRPNGHQGQRYEKVRDECKVNFEAIVAAGGRLTREELMTGTVSQTIEFEDFDLDIILTPSGFTHQCIKDLETMILRYTPEALTAQIKELESRRKKSN